jgi:Pyridine nucleotide-disulphide oxidoreductase
MVFLMPCGRFRDRAWCGGIAGSGLAGGQQPEERDRVHPAQGLVGLLKRRKVTVVNGFGTLTPEGAVAVDGQTLSGKAVVICSGSEPRSLPGLEVDGERIVTSDQVSNSDAKILPERVAVIGGGVIGAEFASVYTDFGVQTTLLEALPHGVLPIGPDRDTADVLAKALAKRGRDIHAEAAWVLSRRLNLFCARGFAHRTRSAGSADLVPGVGDDDLDRRAAAGAPAGKLALRAPAIQVTACSFNRELGRPPGQDATTFRWGCLHGLTRFHDLLGEELR